MDRSRRSSRGSTGFSILTSCKKCGIYSFINTKFFKTHLLNNLRILPLRNSKEEVTLSKVIDPIIELAGFETIDLESVEEEFDSQTGDSIYPIEIDRCLKYNGDPVVFIQCKQLGSKHRLKNDHNKTFKAAKLKI